MGKAKEVRDAAKEYAKDQQRAWRETSPRSSKDVRKLEGTDKKGKK